MPHSPPPGRRRRRKYIRIDHENEGRGQTRLRSPDPDATFVVANSVGAAVVGESDCAFEDGAAGLVGAARLAPGVIALSDEHRGLHAASVSDIGVFGTTTSGAIAIAGVGQRAIGVQGLSFEGIGVQGISGELEPSPGPPPPVPPPPPQIGVLGESVNGIGLQGQSKNFNASQGISQFGIGVRGISEHGPVAVEGINNSESGPAFGVQGISRNGTAVQAVSTNSFGVVAVSQAGSTAIRAIGEQGIGVEGVSNAPTPSGHGVLGTAQQGAGVWGVGGSFGVHGESAATGVDGFSAAGIGVSARSAAGVALQVVGRIQADSAGSGRVFAGQSSATISQPLASPSSQVLVTLQGDPQGAILSHVVLSGGSFAVHLIATASVNVDFSYLVLG